MKIEDYPHFVKTIWTEPNGHTERGLAIAGLGLIGECGEVCEILLEGSTLTTARKIVDECGDVLYYATVIADWKDVHTKDLLPDTKPTLEPKDVSGLMLCARAKEVSERIKKYIRDGKDPSRAEIRSWLRQVLFCLERILNASGATLQDALDENVAKLSVRYKETLENQPLT